MTIQAIPTRYKGYHFRSRLEARWAVFFDALGIRWCYEWQGFDLPSGRYLPDFFLFEARPFPGRYKNSGEYPGYWVEVKGVPPSRHEVALLRELQEGTGSLAYLVEGDPGDFALTVHALQGPGGELFCFSPKGRFDLGKSSPPFVRLTTPHDSSPLKRAEAVAASRGTRFHANANYAGAQA